MFRDEGELLDDGDDNRDAILEGVGELLGVLVDFDRNALFMLEPVDGVLDEVSELERLAEEIEAVAEDVERAAGVCEVRDAAAKLSAMRADSASATCREWRICRGSNPSTHPKIWTSERYGSRIAGGVPRIPDDHARTFAFVKERGAICNGHRIGLVPATTRHIKSSDAASLRPVGWADSLLQAVAYLVAYRYIIGPHVS